jgi:fumarate reductase subunit C
MHDKPVPHHGYVRPMKGWWRTDPFFMRYMAREATAFAVLVYAVILMVGVVRLAQGEAAWNGWLQALRSPWAIALHVVLLISMVVHAQSWFEIMPKTMPMLFMGGRRVGESAIMRTGWTAAVVASLALLALAWWMQP